MGGSEPLISDAVAAGGLLFLSGRADVDPATLEIRSADFATQARNILADVVQVLEEAGSSPAQVLRVECYLANASDFAAWNEVFAEAFPAPRPARMTLVAGFTVPEMLVEIQVTAAVGA